MNDDVKLFIAGILIGVMFVTFFAGMYDWYQKTHDTVKMTTATSGEDLYGFPTISQEDHKCLLMITNEKESNCCNLTKNGYMKCVTTK